MTAEKLIKNSMEQMCIIYQKRLLVRQKCLHTGLVKIIINIPAMIYGRR